MQVVDGATCDSHVRGNDGPCAYRSADASRADRAAAVVRDRRARCETRRAPSRLRRACLRRAACGSARSSPSTVSGGCFASSSDRASTLCATADFASCASLGASRVDAARPRCSKVDAARGACGDGPGRGRRRRVRLSCAAAPPSVFARGAGPCVARRGARACVSAPRRGRFDELPTAHRRCRRASVFDGVGAEDAVPSRRASASAGNGSAAGAGADALAAACACLLGRARRFLGRRARCGRRCGAHVGVSGAARSARRGDAASFLASSGRREGVADVACAPAAGADGWRAASRVRRSLVWRLRGVCRRRPRARLRPCAAPVRARGHVGDDRAFGCRRADGSGAASCTTPIAISADRRRGGKRPPPALGARALGTCAAGRCGSRARVRLASRRGENRGVERRAAAPRATPCATPRRSADRADRSRSSGLRVVIAGLRARHAVSRARSGSGSSRFRPRRR